MTDGEKFIYLLDSYLEAKESVRNYSKIGMNFSDSKKFEKIYNSEIKRENRLKKELAKHIDSIYKAKP
jgi:hypothetical protein